MDTLGEDLFLLSIRPGKGRLWPAVGRRLSFGLAGAEFVRLAAAGRITVDGDRVTVTSEQSTGDPNLDAALSSLAAGGQPVSATKWFRQPRPGIRRAYLNPLVAAGTLVEKPALMFGPKFFVTDDARIARLRAILDAVVHSEGPVDVTSAAYAGLGYVIDLDIALYPNTGYGARLKAVALAPAQAADPAKPADLVKAAEPVDGEPGRVTEAALRAAISTATDAAISATLAVTSTSSGVDLALQQSAPQF